MLEALQFVKRGVARRDFVPGLTHFRIKDRRVTGYNGEYSLSSPVDIGFDVAPQANLFTQALNACDDVIALTVEGSTLLVRSGTFRTAVPCVPLQDVPETVPEGNLLAVHGSLLDAFKSLREFVGTDASRPWATGILFSGQSAFATNNAIVAEYWLGTPFPYVVNVPSAAVDEVIRVGDELTSLQLTDGSITFHYADGRWIKTALLALNWPDILTVLNGVWQGATMTEITSEFAEACEKLSHFGDRKESKLYFRGTDIATLAEGAVSGGALIEMACPSKGIYYTKYLNKMLSAATHADFEAYPRPVPFIGPNLRGCILGVRN
jgi:DNA polymerase III sliding clamp (beta) subunit (PCNA family)